MNDKYTVKQIVFWLNEIRELENVRQFIMKSNHSYIKPKLYSERKIIFNYCHTRELELSEDMTIMIMHVFGEQINKLKQMIAEKDENLVEIATSIYEGEITPKGF